MSSNYLAFPYDELDSMAEMADALSVTDAMLRAHVGGVAFSDEVQARAVQCHMRPPLKFPKLTLNCNVRANSAPEHEEARKAAVRGWASDVPETLHGRWRAESPTV